MFAINVQYPIFVAVLETYEHIKTYKHTNIWTLRYVWGGQSMAGGRALEQDNSGKKLNESLPPPFDSRSQCVALVLPLDLY